MANRKQHSKTSGEWQYDKNNRLKQKGNGSCGSNGTTCYQWDERGNLTQKQEGSNTTNYHYDSSNRLTEVRHNQQLTARYGYDPFNRRIWKEQYRDKQGNLKAQAQRTYYLYSDEGLLAESTQAITVTGDSLTATTAPEITAQYGPRPNSPFTTGTLFVKAKNSNNETTIAYYHHDHLNTPMQATDKDGNVVWSASYEAFGKATNTTPNPTADNPTITSNLRFPGQYEDEETGLHYNFNRYYDTETGRYVTQDPIGLRGGVNFYGYVRGNPIKWSDPLGLIVEIEGDEDFVNATRQALEEIKKHKNGKELYDKLNNSKNTHKIVKRSKYSPGNYCDTNGSYYPGYGSGSTIYFDPYDIEGGGMDTNGSTTRPPFIGLAHEMGHSEAMDEGMQLFPGQYKPIGIPPIERNSLYRENQVRKEHGLDPRPMY